MIDIIFHFNMMCRRPHYSSTRYVEKPLFAVNFHSSDGTNLTRSLLLSLVYGARLYYRGIQWLEALNLEFADRHGKTNCTGVAHPCAAVARNSSGRIWTIIGLNGHFCFSLTDARWSVEFYKNCAK